MKYEEEYQQIHKKMFELKLKITRLEERSHPELYKEMLEQLKQEYEELKNEMYKCKYRHYEQKKEGR